MTLENETASRPWTSLYENTVKQALPLEIADMATAFRRTVARLGNQTAIQYFDASYTYAAVDAMSDALAAWLHDEGVGAGDRIVIVLQNVPQFVLFTLAAWKLSAVPTPINPMYRQRELSAMLADAAPKVVICDVGGSVIVATALEAADTHAILVTTASVPGRDMLARSELEAAADVAPAVDFADVLHRFEGRKPPSTVVKGADLGLLMYTSGTSGRPKGAMLSHASLAVSTHVTGVWMKHRPGAIVLIIAPLFHITGFVMQMASAIEAGSTLLLPFRMVPNVVLDLIRTHRPTHTIGAITAFNAFLNVPGVTAADFLSFERVFSGGAPIPPALRITIEAKIGIRLHPGYGMTETAGLAHFSPFGAVVPVDPASGALAIGVPAPGTDAIVVDDNGAILPPGHPGELLLRGPQIMAGYWRMPAETAETLASGWMHSGDVAVMDEQGWFYIVDRKKDVIIASGFKVWPREVEDCLYEHEAVLEAAVVGFEDSYRGESVKGFVSLRTGSTASPEALTAHCRERLAAYKVPRMIEILSELPKTVTGKIQRVKLRST